MELEILELFTVEELTKLALLWRDEDTLTDDCCETGQVFAHSAKHDLYTTSLQFTLHAFCSATGNLKQPLKQLPHFVTQVASHSPFFANGIHERVDDAADVATDDAGTEAEELALPPSAPPAPAPSPSPSPSSPPGPPPGGSGGEGGS